MMTRTLDFYMAAIQEKTFVGSKGCCSESAVLRVGIQDITLRVEKLCSGSVKVWIVNIPEMRILDFESFCCAGDMMVL